MNRNTLNIIINGLNSICDIFSKKINKQCCFLSAWNVLGFVYDKNGGSSSRSTEDIDRQIKLIKNNNIKKAQVILTLGFNQTNKKIYIAGSPENYEKVDYLINKLIENNISVELIKIHYNYKLEKGENNKQWMIDTLGSYESFLNLYNTKVLEIANRYKTKVKRIIPYNEMCTDCYTDVRYKSYCINCIESLQDLGYKVSISCMGMNDFNNMLVEIKDKLDFLSCNIYPSGGNKGENSTLSDIVNSFINHEEIDDFIYYCRTHYNNKQIWITETGCTDNTNSLNDPSNSTIAENDKCYFDGELQRKYIKALLSLYADKVDYICYFWELRGNKTTNLFK